MVTQVVGRKKPVFPPDSYPSLSVNPRFFQLGQWHPKNQCNFIVGLQGWSSVDGEDEGPYDDWPGDGSLGRDIIENAEQAGWIERERELLTSLPDGGGQQVFVVGLESASRQPHVTRPGISHPVRSPDEKNRIGIWRHDNGNAGQ